MTQRKLGIDIEAKKGRRKDRERKEREMESRGVELRQTINETGTTGME